MSWKGRCSFCASEDIVWTARQHGWAGILQACEPCMDDLHRKTVALNAVRKALRVGGKPYDPATTVRVLELA